MTTADDYYWPAHWSERPVLRNNLGIRDQTTLDRAERILVARAAQRIRAGRIQIERTYDVPHLKAINRAVGGKIYPWAGEFRTCLLSKSPPGGGPVHTFMSPGPGLERWMEYVMGKRVRGLDWGGLSRDEIVSRSTELYADVNFGHAFRELNGNSQRIFLDQVHEQTAWCADYSLVSKEAWAEASAGTFPPGRPEGFRPADGLNYEPLRLVLDQVIVPRPQSGLAPSSGVSRVHGLLVTAGQLAVPLTAIRPPVTQRPALSGPPPMRRLRGPALRPPGIDR